MDHYYHKLCAGFRAVNGDERDVGRQVIFKIVLTASHVCIYFGDTCVFQTGRDAVSVRNIYLELYSCRYNVAEWLRQRQMGAFNNQEYQSTNGRCELVDKQ
jgi:hypothetical protein